MGSERSQTKNSTFYMIPFILNYRKCKLTYNNRKQISGCLEMGNSRTGRWNYKEAHGNFGGDGYVHHFDYKIV